MSLISCDKISLISQDKWNEVLNAIETSIIKHQDIEDIILLSSTTAPKEINQILIDYLIENDNEYAIFSCDIIIEFLISTSKAIENKMQQVSPAIYQNLIDKNAMSIIHCPSGDIFNLPRIIADFNENTETETENADIFNEEEHFISDTLSIEFMNYPKYFDIIQECVYENMREILTTNGNTVKLVHADWSKRSEFYGILEIGYRGNDGKIVPADVILQKENQIFIHCGNNANMSNLQRKFGWINVPNDRITPPVKRKKTNTTTLYDARTPRQVTTNTRVNQWVFYSYNESRTANSQQSNINL